MPDLEFLHGRHLPRCTAVVDSGPDYCSLQMMRPAGASISVTTSSSTSSPGSTGLLVVPRPVDSLPAARPGNPYWVHRYVAFRGALMTRWQEAGLLPFMPQRVPARGDFVRRFDELLQLFARPDRLGHLRAVNLLEGLLLHLADSRRPEKALWLDRAKELVLQLPGFRPDYSWVADQLGMALSTFRRAFRREAELSGCTSFCCTPGSRRPSTCLLRPRPRSRASPASLAIAMCSSSRGSSQVAAMPPATYRSRARSQADRPSEPPT